MTIPGKPDILKPDTVNTVPPPVEYEFGFRDGLAPRTKKFLKDAENKLPAEAKKDLKPEDTLKFIIRRMWQGRQPYLLDLSEHYVQARKKNLVEQIKASRQIILEAEKESAPAIAAAQRVVLDHLRERYDAIDALPAIKKKIGPRDYPNLHHVLRELEVRIQCPLPGFLAVDLVRADDKGANKAEGRGNGIPISKRAVDKGLKEVEERIIDLPARRDLDTGT